MTTQTPDRIGAVFEPQRTRWVPWALLVAVLAIAGAGLWLFLGDEGSPMATFDGQTVTYEGPTTFDAGEVTFTFDASAHEPGVVFVLGRVTDDAVTMADMEAWAEVNPASDIPPFVGAFETAWATDDDRIVEKAFDLESGTRYSIWANTAPTDTNRAHPAVIIDVR